MGKDKWMHMGVCCAITLAVAGVGLAVGFGLAASLYAGALTSLAAGVGKEVADAYCGYNQWSWGDFAADVAGVVIGCLAACLF